MKFTPSELRHIRRALLDAIGWDMELIEAHRCGWSKGRNPARIVPQEWRQTVGDAKRRIAAYQKLLAKISTPNPQQARSD